MNLRWKIAITGKVHKKRQLTVGLQPGLTTFVIWNKSIYQNEICKLKVSFSSGKNSSVINAFKINGKIIFKKFYLPH